MKRKIILSMMSVLGLLNWSGCVSNSSSKEAGEKTSQELTEKRTDDNSLKENQPMKVIHLTTEEFKKKIFDYENNKEWKFQGDRPAIVDFYASWCGPCKMLAPVLDELAVEFEGKIDIYKVDTEAEQELSAAFGIRSIPSILFIPMQGTPTMANGFIPKMQMQKAINDILLKTE